MIPNSEWLTIFTPLVLPKLYETTSTFAATEIPCQVQTLRVQTRHCQ